MIEPLPLRYHVVLTDENGDVMQIDVGKYEEIYELRQRGMTYQELADNFKLQKRTIQKICLRYKKEHGLNML